MIDVRQRQPYAMRRVLLTVHKFFPQHRAGTEVLTLKVAQELQRRGMEVLVVTANPPDLDARRKSEHTIDSHDYVYDGVRVHVIEEALRLRGFTFEHEFLHEQIGAHFGELLREFRPDLVHIFHSQNLSASIIDETKKHGIPIVSSLTDYWFICPVVQLKRPDGALCEGPTAGATNCLTCYTPKLFPPSQEVAEAVATKLPAIGRAIDSMPQPVKQLANETIAAAFCASKLPSAVAATIKRPGALRQRLNQVDSIMVPTKLMLNLFIKNGINSGLLSHVPFGMDTSGLIDFQNKTDSDVVRIGFIGTIFEHKGLDLLVDAMHKLPPNSKCILKIYGDTSQFPEYAERVTALAQHGPNASKIQFLGTFANEKLGEVLSNIDVLVVPSRWYENTPLVIQSALATKTPVIATDLGGMSELIKHNFNGLLFQVNDSDELHLQLARILNEPGLLPQLRANIARERTIGEMVDDIQSIYETVLNRKRGRNQESTPFAGQTMLS